MAIRFDRDKTPAVVRLEGEIDIASAAELKQVLLVALAAGDTRISLEIATGLDATAVQMLWAAERAARASGTVLTLEGSVPETLRATLRAAGFQPLPFAEEADPASEVRA
ncbi:MAG TPA: STAS domain-containing protein [Acidobacteriaceae bacterium]|nr:STAS domain-containing protein [Acidobacteriaceae bacterium]